MATLNYNGDVVNSAVENISSVINQFQSLSTSIKAATAQIVGSRGFDEYIGSIKSDTFSGYVEECQASAKSLIQNIRQMQIQIMSYSQDDTDIQTFLNTLNRVDYEGLDMSGISDHISLGRKVGNRFKGLFAGAMTLGTGAIEGVLDFGETAGDLVVTAGSGIASIFTSGYDFFTGSNVTDELERKTKAFVSTKHVENIFNSMYDNSKLGQYMKNNVINFDAIRGLGKGIGYSSAMIGFNAVTGGLASGLGVGAAGSVSAAQMASTAGLMGFSNGVEEAWADGATTGKGLVYGVASGTWEALQWGVGAKINQLGGVGDQLAKTIFKDGAKSATTRVALDTIDSGVEGFVQPALSMIYKDYGKDNLAANYKEAFTSSGGWGNVFSQAALGGIMSTGSELLDARKILKSNKKATTTDFQSSSNKKSGMAALITENELAQRLFKDNEVSARTIGVGAADFADSLRATDFTESGSRTIDGGFIKHIDHEFNTKTGSRIPSTYKWFTDGSYLPNDVATNQAKGIFKNFERNMTSSEMKAVIEKNRASLSGVTYTRLNQLNDIFQAEGGRVNLNELKLILFHSEGNLGRIKSALSMSYENISEETLDRVSKRIAKELFPTSNNAILRKTITDDYIDRLRRESKDDWKAASKIFASINSKELIKEMAAETPAKRFSIIKNYFGKSISDDMIKQIVNCDGYPSTIKKILQQDKNIPNYLLDNLSQTTAAKAFGIQNLARIKAAYEVNKRNFSQAIKLTSKDSQGFNAYSDLLKAMNVFSPSGARKVYYHMIDSFPTDYGLSLEQATQQAKLISMNALSELGMSNDRIDLKASSVFSREDMLYGWNKGLFSPFDFPGKKASTIPNYIRRNYMTSSGDIDSKRLVNDFSNLMNSKRVVINANTTGVEQNYSLAANELFRSSFIKASLDQNNPNRNEALKFMSKILELDAQGKKLIVSNDGGRTGSHRLKNRINLDICTTTGEQIGTVFHENGHFIFGASIDERYPLDYEEVRKRAVANLENPMSQELLKKFGENINEVNYYCQYRAEQQLESVLKKNNYASIEDYRNYLIKKYESLSIEDRKQTLANTSSRSGNMLLGTFDKSFKNKLDFKSAENCADIQLNAIKGKIVDQIYRKEFADYEVTSSVIDSATRGKTRFCYGHGDEYFETRADPNKASYHELIADYSALKVEGNNKTLNFLRYVLGDELFNTIDNTYETMLR